VSVPSFEFEGRPVVFESKDTVASALYRAGVRTFSRSFKFHRRRGLYCLTGDCPNCLCRVDGVPGLVACMTPASEVAHVEREGGWPSVDRDVMSVAWHFRRLLPVGFYYKLVPSARAWAVVEPWVRKAAGRGGAPEPAVEAGPRTRHVHPDVLVIGAGPAGLAAAVAAADAGEQVLVVDETMPAAELAPGPTAQAVAELVEDVEKRPAIELLTQATALAIHEGPLVTVRRRHELVLAHPARIIVATGAVEAHAAVRGNDLPGVWLARGAARLAGRHRLPIGRRFVFVGATEEAVEHLRTLEVSGARAVAVLFEGEPMTGRDHAGLLRPGACLVAVHGRGRVRAVTIQTGKRRERVRCDSVVIAPERIARDGLLRQAAGLQCVIGAGEAVEPNLSLLAAIESGKRAAALALTEQPSASVAGAVRGGGFVCLCEDVRVADLEQAWAEGYQSTELLKRYTTTTMGPCQGAMCHHLLRAFVSARSAVAGASAATTARPPARGASLLELAAGARRPIEERTALHDLHVERGATWEWAGAWRRPTQYVDLDEEYWAVRERVGIMDVGTLGKVHVAGRDAAEFLERIYPCALADLEPGSLRYGLVLSEAGHIFDDGVICAIEDGLYYLTFTTSGASAAEAWLRRWASTWDLRVHIVNQTRSLGAINVAGPLARDVLAKLTSDDISASAFPYLRHRTITLAGISVRALRLGFVGELAYELHHPSSRSRELWTALVEAGREVDMLPHGLETVSRLRLEKGHIIVGQDTDFDTIPSAVGLDWAVSRQKEFFLGQAALDRAADVPLRRRLVGIRWIAEAPAEGSVLTASGQVVGAVTSSGDAKVLGQGVSLAWLNCGSDGAMPAAVATGHLIGAIAPVPFYDPEGARQRV
jgi:sarcosine oxidase subunit alpha